MWRLIAGAIALSLTACGGVWTPADGIPPERACAGLPDAEVDAALAQLRANVVSVEALREDEGPKRTPRTVGAVLAVRATPGATPSWLGRVLACDAERRSAALAPAGSLSEVTPTRTGFAVAIRSRDVDVALEIGRRARALEQSARGGAGARQAMGSMR